MSNVSAAAPRTPIQAQFEFEYQETRDKLQAVLGSPLSTEAEKAEAQKMIDNLDRAYQSVGPSPQDWVLAQAIKGFDTMEHVADTLFGDVLFGDTPAATDTLPVEDTTVTTGSWTQEVDAQPAPVEMLVTETVSEAAPSAEHNLLDMMANPEAMLDLYDRDPAAFQAAFREVPDNLKASVMQVIQSQMQENNQVAQLMSNLMSAEHQTAKAVIGNIRV